MPRKKQNKNTIQTKDNKQPKKAKKVKTQTGKRKRLALEKTALKRPDTESFHALWIKVVILTFFSIKGCFVSTVDDRINNFLSTLVVKSLSIINFFFLQKEARGKSLLLSVPQRLQVFILAPPSLNL